MNPTEKLELVFGTSRPVALVTGSGAPRVGGVVARHLAGRGYRVVIHANRSLNDAGRTVEELRRAGVDAFGASANLADESCVGLLFAEIAERFGRLDALVNCAAIWERKPLEEVRAADVRRHFEVNTLGTFLCCQAAGRMMIPQSHGGAIVNLGDWATARPYCDFAAYFPSKGAVEAMTRSFAVELAERNPRIRVNAILPGPVMLPDDLPAEERAASIAGTLVKREGSPQHVADAVSFLLENDFITGVCLPVDGGRTLA